MAMNLKKFINLIQKNLYTCFKCSFLYNNVVINQKDIYNLLEAFGIRGWMGREEGVKTEKGGMKG